MDKTFGRKPWAPAKVWGLIASAYCVCLLALLLPRHVACLDTLQWPDVALLVIAFAVFALAAMVGVADRRRLIFVFPAVALATLYCLGAIAVMAAGGHVMHPTHEGRVSDICFVST